MAELKSLWWLYTPLKLLPIIASIELLGFFVLHLAGPQRGLLLQGFLGGFVSSNMVYLSFREHLHRDQKSWAVIMPGLLMSNISMLLLCLIIILSLNRELFFYFATPIVLQMVTIFLLVIYFSYRNRLKHPKLTSHFSVDEPVVWRKVLTFISLFILILIGLDLILAQFPETTYFSLFLISLFESHAILAASITNGHLSKVNHQGQIIIILILFGSITGKMILIGPKTNMRTLVRIGTILLLSLFPTLIVFSFNIV